MITLLLKYGQAKGTSRQMAENIKNIQYIIDHNLDHILEKQAKALYENDLQTFQFWMQKQKEIEETDMQVFYPELRDVPKKKDQLNAWQKIKHYIPTIKKGLPLVPKIACIAAFILLSQGRVVYAQETTNNIQSQRMSISQPIKQSTEHVQKLQKKVMKDDREDQWIWISMNRYDKEKWKLYEQLRQDTLAYEIYKDAYRNILNGLQPSLGDIKEVKKWWEEGFHYFLDAYQDITKKNQFEGIGDIATRIQKHIKAVENLDRQKINFYLQWIKNWEKDNIADIIKVYEDIGVMINYKAQTEYLSTTNKKICEIVKSNKKEIIFILKKSKWKILDGEAIRDVISKNDKVFQRAEKFLQRCDDTIPATINMKLGTTKLLYMFSNEIFANLLNNMMKELNLRVQIGEIQTMLAKSPYTSLFKWNETILHKAQKVLNALKGKYTIKYASDLLNILYFSPEIIDYDFTPLIIKYNLTNFDRYNLSIIKRIKENDTKCNGHHFDKDSNKNAVVFYSKSDHVNALSYHQLELDSIPKNWNIRAFEVSSEKEIYTIMDTLDVKPNLVVFPAHGNKDAITLGFAPLLDMTGKDTLSTKDLKEYLQKNDDAYIDRFDTEITKKILEKMEPEGRVVFAACLTGLGEDQEENLVNFFRKGSKSIKIYGATKEIQTTKFIFDKEGNLIDVKFGTMFGDVKAYAP